MDLLSFLSPSLVVFDSATWEAAVEMLPSGSRTGQWKPGGLCLTLSGILYFGRQLGGYGDSPTVILKGLRGET